MKLTTAKVLLLSALFCSALCGIIAMSTAPPVDLYGDPIGSGHPYISPTSNSHLCGDPIGSGHPYANQSA